MVTSPGDGCGQSCPSRRRTRFALAAVAGLLLAFFVFTHAWVALAGLFLFALVGYLDRCVFPQGFSPRFRSGWLVLGVMLGALIGSGFCDNCSDGRIQRLESAIHTMEGAIFGTLIGMVIDYARNASRARGRTRFHFWHVLACLWICAVSVWILLTLLEMYKLRSTPIS